MRFLYVIILLSSMSNVIGQVLTNEPDKKETKNEEKKEIKPKTGLEIYFGVSPAYTDRTLTKSETLFGKELGEREKEEGDWVTSFAAGIRNQLNENFLMELGVGFSRNKEVYSFSDTDTLHNYENTYQHISFPIRLAYTFGKDVSFYGGIGVMPKAFISLRRDVTTLDVNGQEKEEKIIEKDGFNFFVIDAMATVGTRIKFNPNYGVFAMLEGRKQLTNNYDDQGAYVRKPYALGFHFGFQVYL
ncbi:MAG: hypothetical protein WED10_08680 [Brumimicrobium sp.]